jgi:hypothetical protein
LWREVTQAGPKSFNGRGPYTGFASTLDNELNPA